MEGLTQNTVDNLVDKAVYDKDKPYFSTTDENAVLNPKVAAANAVSDMATAMAVGGGQLLTDAAAKRLRNAWEQKRLEWTASGENLRADGLGEDTVRAALALPEGTGARNLVNQAAVTRQAEILGKLEELEAAKKQAGEIRTSEQLLEFTRTVGRLEQELEALEQGRLSDWLSSEDLGRLSETVQTNYAELTAAGTIDIIDSQVTSYIETLKSRNMKLEGMTHKVTDVPFERCQVEMDGTLYEMVAPRFESFYTVQLPEELYLASNRVQFKNCSMETYQATTSDPQLRGLFSDEQLEQMRNGKTPDGYTWHHNVKTGEMQLVDSELHKKTGHTGGKYLWGVAHPIVN